MGMAGRLTKRWGDANATYLAGQQRASDVAGGLGAVAKVLRMMLQSAVLAVGAYLVIHQEATAGIIIAGSILSARALAPVDLAIANWKGFVAARQSWHRLNKLLEQILPAQRSRSLLQEPADAAVGRGRQHRAAGRAARHRAGRQLRAGGRHRASASSGRAAPASRRWCARWSASGMPARGKVRLDGAALDQWSPDVLGRHIGYLPQDVELFAGTVAQNISPFRSRARRPTRSSPPPRPPACTS